ncbi:MAG: hypothetical protein E6J90_43905 [Deltaproteobacteria bacterium]|nr:MAG: hypothetical protein E6J90_43905 [Deltaproteobacteria bacterium]
MRTRPTNDATAAYAPYPASARLRWYSAATCARSRRRLRISTTSDRNAGATTSSRTLTLGKPAPARR